MLKTVFYQLDSFHVIYKKVKIDFIYFSFQIAIYMERAQEKALDNNTKCT